MKLIIDIPENIYDTIQADEMISREQLAVLQMHILNGAPLPKGHGRLGDLDAVMSDISTSIDNMTNIGIAVDGEYLWAKLNDAIDNAQTIIEADTESEE